MGQLREVPDSTYVSPIGVFWEVTQRTLGDGNAVFYSDLQRPVLSDDGIQARDVSQGPGFLFVDLCHVVTDHLDLHEDRIRFTGETMLMGTHSSLDAIRLE